MKAPTRTLAASLVSGALGLVLYAAPAAAQYQTTEAPQSARTLALGGGGHAVASSTSGIFVNPAAMALTRVYHLDAMGSYDPTISRWGLTAAVVDTTRRVGAGLAYTFSDVDFNGDTRSGHDARLALSASLSDAISLGATLRYLNQGGAATANGRLGTQFSGFTVDAGLAVRPVRMLSFGVAGFSLTNPETSLAPLSLGAGVGVTPIETLTLVADMIWDFRSYPTPQARYSFGAEFLAGRIPLRAGFIHDDARNVQTVTAGLGYIDQSFSIEGSLRQDVNGASPMQTTLLLSLRYFYRAL